MSEISPTKHTILNDVEITGTLKFKGELTFGGTFKQGSIEGESLIVAKDGRIHGNIRVATLNLLGAVTGDVAVSEKCEIGAHADFTGSLSTVRLAMAEGASVNGQVQIGPSQGVPKNDAAARKNDPGVPKK